jgi:hypothetical protein
MSLKLAALLAMATALAAPTTPSLALSPKLNLLDRQLDMHRACNDLYPGRQGMRARMQDSLERPPRWICEIGQLQYPITEAQINVACVKQYGPGSEGYSESFENGRVIWWCTGD